MKKSGLIDQPVHNLVRKPGEGFGSADIVKRSPPSTAGSIRAVPNFSNDDETVTPASTSEQKRREQELPVPENYAAKIMLAPRADGGIPLHVDKLKVWKRNPRHVVDSSKLPVLATSLRAIGQEQLIEVIPDKEAEGHYLIFAGQRRWMAVRDYNINDGIIYARIRTDLTTDEAIFAAALDPQVMTEPLRAIDLAISLATSDSDTVGAAMARALNKDPSEISKLRQIGQLPEIVLSVLKAGADKFSYPFAYEVVHVFNSLGEGAAAEFANEIIKQNLTYKLTVAKRDERISGKVKKDRQAWTSQHKTSRGSVKMRESSGDILVDLTGLNEEAFKAIKMAIESALAVE